MCVKRKEDDVARRKKEKSLNDDDLLVYYDFKNIDCYKNSSKGDQTSEKKCKTKTFKKMLLY